MDLSGKKQRTHAAVFIAWGKSVLHMTLHGRDRAYMCTWISQVSFPLTVWLCAFNVLVMSTTMLSFLSPSSESLVSHLGDLWHRPLKYNRIKGSVSTENKLSSPSSIIPKSDREGEVESGIAEALHNRVCYKTCNVCARISDHYCSVPSFNFEVGLRLGRASEVQERVPTQNVFHANPFFFSFLFLFLSVTGEDSRLLTLTAG